MKSGEGLQGRLRWFLSGAESRRIRLFTLGVIATLAFLILPSLNTWNVYRASGEISSQEVELERLMGSVVHLDGILTMSARLAAATGEERWEQRYRRYEPKLTDAIEQMIDLSEGAYVAAAERVDAANRNLVAIENRAFDRVRAGRREEASELLFGEVYSRNKHDYSDAMQTLNAAIDERIRRDVQQSERRVLGAGAVMVASAGALLLAWVGVVGLIWRHLAAREKAEDERRYLETQIQHVQKLESLGVMAGGIAHDFNNLLVPVLGHVGLALIDLPKDSPSVPGLRKAQDAGRRLSELTTQLMAYAGSVAFDLRPIDLSALIGAMDDLLRLSVSKNAELRFDLADDLPAVDADASQLGQVAMNLVANASEAFDGAGGVVAVRTGITSERAGEVVPATLEETLPEGPSVFLEVSDSGCGMDDATRRQIFDPFFTTKFTGRGLGLAVVGSIVRGHRGAICVSSRPSGGTTFRILFGCSERPAEPLVQQREIEERKLYSGTVLIVDDDPDVRELTEEMLQRMGFRVLAAQEGREGVEMFCKHGREIDVVLLDATMPGMSGEEALEEIHRLQPDQRIVMMSGYSEEYALSRLRGQITGFLKKPFTPEQLAEAVDPGPR